VIKHTNDAIDTYLDFINKIIEKKEIEIKKKKLEIIFF
jgi:hypothetical protein